MHGRKKVVLSEEQVKSRNEKLTAKLAVYSELMDQIKEIQLTDHDQLLKLTKMALSVHPDLTHLWNHRKDVYIALKTELIENPTEFDKLCNGELEFVVDDCLKKEPKSYSCWFQLKYIINLMYSPDIDYQLGLTNQYLSVDDRNFHCWNYRRFLLKKKSDFPTSNANANDNTNAIDNVNANELSITENMIADNLSNFSAWHHRSLMFIKHYNQLDVDPAKQQQLLEHEINLINNAIYTDSNDSSVWLYCSWIFSNVRSNETMDIYPIFHSLRRTTEVAFFDDNTPIDEMEGTSPKDPPKVEPVPVYDVTKQLLSFELNITLSESVVTFPSQLELKLETINRTNSQSNINTNSKSSISEEDRSYVECGVWINNLETESSNSWRTNITIYDFVTNLDIIKCSFGANHTFKFNVSEKYSFVNNLEKYNFGPFIMKRTICESFYKNMMDLYNEEPLNTYLLKVLIDFEWSLDIILGYEEIIKHLNTLIELDHTRKELRVTVDYRFAKLAKTGLRELSLNLSNGKFATVDFTTSSLFQHVTMLDVSRNKHLSWCSTGGNLNLLSNLTVFAANNCSLYSLEFLNGCAHINTIRANYNLIKELDNIKPLTNRITDLPLSIDIEGNPITNAFSNLQRTNIAASSATIADFISISCKRPILINQQPLLSTNS